MTMLHTGGSEQGKFQSCNIGRTMQHTHRIFYQAIGQYIQNVYLNLSEIKAHIQARFISATFKFAYHALLQAFWNALNSNFCTCRDTLGKLLRFSSSKSGDKLTSLQEVVSRMQPNQKDIYFVATETKEAAESSPFVERLSKKDFEVRHSAIHMSSEDKRILLLLYLWNVFCRAAIWDWTQSPVSAT